MESLELVEEIVAEAGPAAIWIPRLFCLLALVVGYICGMFQSAFFISKAMHVDIYSKGSGNPGTTNMLRVLGPVPGILTFLLDIGKAVGAIFLTRFLFITLIGSPIDRIALLLYTGLGVVLGHNFPAYLRGRGGKGVAVTCTIFVMLGEWKYIIAGVVVFFVIFLITRYVSLSSICVSIVLMIEFILCTLMGWTKVAPGWKIDCIVLVIILAGLVVATHRKNIMRLIRKEEPKFTFHKNKTAETAEQTAEPDK